MDITHEGAMRSRLFDIIESSEKWTLIFSRTTTNFMNSTAVTFLDKFCQHKVKKKLFWFNTVYLLQQIYICYFMLLSLLI